MVKAALFGVALLFALGCSSDSEETSARPEAAREPVAAAIEEKRMTPGVAALNIKNAHQMSSQLLTGGQLSKEQMAQLHQLGFRTFINLRPANEEGTGWEEEYTAAEGITFHRLPVAGAPGLNGKNVQELARLLEQAEGDPVAVYCGSGNRVGALLALKAHDIDGLSVEEAVAYGVNAGMTRLEPIIRSKLSVE